MWQERADYGHFFYRIPNGESAADAYDRVSGFNESLWRSFGEDDFASVSVLVTHGLMTRVFLMKWYHFSVEYFEDLRNVNHCEFVVMRKNPDNGKYILQNQLRTWSELKKERASIPESPIPVRKKWGGCPDGCDHSSDNLVRRQARRQNTADLFMEDGTSPVQQIEQALNRRSSKSSKKSQVEDEQPDDPRGRVHSPSFNNPAPTNPASESNTNGMKPKPTTRNSPRGSRLKSPNRIEFLQAGRDGGGSRSGDASSDEEEHTENENKPSIPPRRSMALALNGAFDDDRGMKSGARADALGDQSDIDEEEEGDLLERLEAHNKSFEGSVC